jgi:plasmid stability protein
MNLTIKDLPGPLHKKLKARAASSKRSLNWEVIDLLEMAVEMAPQNVQELIKQIDRVHGRIKVRPLNEDILRRAKSEGRR